MPVIAVDAMGGDLAPDETVKGVAEVSLATQIECLLVGDERRIQAVLERVPYNPEHIAILHCRDAIAAADDPREAVRTRKDASLLVALRAVADGRAEALVTAGPPGACLLGAARHLRLVPGVRHPALAGVCPRHTERPDQDAFALLLDVGAGVHADADALVQFALLGTAYARRVSKLPAPRVGLLAMTTAAALGDEVHAEAHRRLAHLPGIEFAGDVLGHELVGGRADVVVCDGRTGNVAHALYGGFAEPLRDVARAAADRPLMWRVGLRLLSQGVERLQTLTDDSRYGGAPLLGYEQLVLLCRGRAVAHTIANAVKLAAKAVRDRVVPEVAHALGGRV